MEKSRRHRRSGPAVGMTAVSGRMSEAWQGLGHIFLALTGRKNIDEISVRIVRQIYRPSFRPRWFARATVPCLAPKRSERRAEDYGRGRKRGVGKKDSKSSRFVPRRLYELAVDVR